MNFRIQIKYMYTVYFTDSIHKYTDYLLFGVMYAHAHTRYTRPPFSSRPGIEANHLLSMVIFRAPNGIRMYIESTHPSCDGGGHQNIVLIGLIII